MVKLIIKIWSKIKNYKGASDIKQDAFNKEKERMLKELEKL